MDISVNREELARWAKEAFVKIQKAWNDDDFNSLIPYESTLLLERDEKEMNRLRVEGKKNVRKNVNCQYEEVYDISNINMWQIAKVKMQVTLEDYVYEIGTEEVTKGIRDYIVTRNYYLVLKRKLGFNEESSVQNVKCIACNADIDLNASGKCEYCGTMAHTENHDWVIEEINYEE